MTKEVVVCTKEEFENLVFDKYKDCIIDIGTTTNNFCVMFFEKNDKVYIRDDGLVNGTLKVSGVEHTFKENK